MITGFKLCEFVKTKKIVKFEDSKLFVGFLENSLIDELTELFFKLVENYYIQEALIKSGVTIPSIQEGDIVWFNLNNLCKYLDVKPEVIFNGGIVIE